MSPIASSRTPRRSFIVADTPGHEQYTRNMATGASTPTSRCILVDARKGVLTQTQAAQLHLRPARHPRRRARGQQDRPDGLRPGDVFDRIVGDYVDLRRAARLPLRSRPSRSARGSATTSRRARAIRPGTPGPTLLEHLETVEVEDELAEQAVPLPGAVGQPADLDFRGFSGTVASGRSRSATRSWWPPRARPARVARIVTADGDLARGRAGQAVTLTLHDEIDVARGDLLAHAATGRPCRRPVRRPPALDGR